MQRDWQIVANRLRRMIEKTVLGLEGEIDRRDGDDFVRAEALEKLATAALWACNLDITAATLANRVGRDGGYG